MKKRILLLLGLCMSAQIVLTGCGDNSSQQETTDFVSDNVEKTTTSKAEEETIDFSNITYANDEDDEVAKTILDSILGDNSSSDKIIYDLNLNGKIGKYIVRFEIFENDDNDVLAKDGSIKKAPDKDTQVIISATIGKNVRYYKFNILGKSNCATEMLEIYADQLLCNVTDIRDNLTLLDKTGMNDEITVTWEIVNPDDADVITLTPTGENNEIPAGVITRGDTDKNITLKAKLQTEVDGKTLTTDRTFDITIKAKPASKEYSAYVYTYFRGNIYGNGESQHIHMAVSKDGYFWDAINDNEPVLKAYKGTGGARDSFLIRSPYGDKFYLIATDLDANGGDWAAYANRGSKAIRVWESTDLVNWSEERLIDIAPNGAGCMWAPECHYDASTGEYVVYFSTGIVGGNGKKIYYVKTRDFYHFTEAKIFKDVEGKTTFIDTSITEHNGTYYRFTKNENEITILVEKSDSLLGEYSLIKTRIANQWGVEGPGIYKINGEEKWCLYMDGYANENAGVGYFPLIAESEEDLKTGNFRKLESDEYEMPKGAKHGSFVPITEEEYNALVEKWGI